MARFYLFHATGDGILVAKKSNEDNERGDVTGEFQKCVIVLSSRHIPPTVVATGLQRTFEKARHWRALFV